MAYWALSHSRWRAAAPSPRMFLSQTWDGWPKSTQARLKKQQLHSNNHLLLVFVCSCKGHLWAQGQVLLFQIFEFPLERVADKASRGRLRLVLPVRRHREKTQTGRWFRRCWCKKKRRMDERMMRMERSRRRAAGLVLALLGCVGVKLQQLILQVQLVVQLSHLQVTYRISCCDCATGNKQGSSLLHVVNIC